MKPTFFAAVALAAVFLAPNLFAQPPAPEWPQFQGPNRDGISPETGLLKDWPKDGPPLVWSIKGLGEGYSSISVKDGRIYTMGTSDGGECVFAFDFNSGKPLWKFQSSPTIFQVQQGNGPRCTPTTDGELLYTEDALGILTCLEAATGKLVWQKGLVADLGGRVPQWGYTESPLILDDHVIVTPGGSKGAIAALDKKTGALVWQSTGIKGPAAYSSCVVATFGPSRQIINCIANKMISVDAATGKFLWEFSDPIPEIVCTSPLVYQDMVFGTANYKKGSGVVRVTDKGAEKLWYDKSFGNHHGGVIRIGDYLYGMFDGYDMPKDDGMMLRCIEMKTGKVMSSDKDVGKGSLVYADGLFYCLAEKHVVHLIEASPGGFKEHGRFKIKATSKRDSWPHPVVVGGRLFIRDQDSLTCWDVKAK